jgi:hypothetical protein
MANRANVTKVFTDIFSNGRGEAGLEVGSDPGLPLDQHIRIPRCMVKAWAGKLDDAEIGRYMADDTTAPPEDGDKALTATQHLALHGWVTSTAVTVHEGDVNIIHNNEFYTMAELVIDPPTYDDCVAFYTVNQDHVRAAEFTPETVKWIHACRFWAVVSGFVVSSKSDEYVIVDDPAANTAPADADEVVGYIANFRENAWTASAARAASWRKTNHCTGGDIVQGFPRRWLQKMGFFPTPPDRTAAAAAQREVTSAFYIATHASSVHAVLALMAPGDTNHWAVINPAQGLIHTWDIKDSARIRMTPNTQVAGSAMVTDAIVCLKMLVREGLAPLLTNVDQAAVLYNAYQEIEAHGVRTAVYAGWFLDGHPAAVSKLLFDQKAPGHAALLGELAIVATVYYRGTTIAGSASLANAATQLGEDSARTTWAALARQKQSLSAQQVVKAYARIRGATAQETVIEILSNDQTVVDAAVVKYNDLSARLSTQLGLGSAVLIDSATIMANAGAADRLAAQMLGVPI